MPQFTLTAAGIPAGATVLFDSTRDYCAAYLTDAAPELSVTVTPADLELERQKAAREDALEGLPVRNLPDRLLELTALQRKLVEQLFDRDVLLFHGSVLAMDGAAYLFTAKSGTGKSTHTRLWRQVFGDRVKMVNDDKPFLRFDGDTVYACGSPWKGKHGLGENIQVPLRAICILERGEENEITPLAPADALFTLIQQSSRPADPKHMGAYMTLLDRLSRSVSFYRLRCNMTEEAPLTAYKAMHP